MNKEAVRSHVKLNEGFRQFAYKCPADKWTIGYGRNLEDNGISEVEAEILLADDLERISDAFDRNIPWWTGRPDDAQTVMFDIAYQCGIAGLLGFRNMLACIHAGDFDGAANQLMDSALAKQAPERTVRNAKLLHNCTQGV